MQLNFLAGTSFGNPYGVSISVRTDRKFLGTITQRQGIRGNWTISPLLRYNLAIASGATHSEAKKRAFLPKLTYSSRAIALDTVIRWADRGDAENIPSQD